MSLTTHQPSVYTSANIYREMDTPKYLNTITYNDRLNDRSKRPLDPILPRHMNMMRIMNNRQIQSKNIIGYIALKVIVLKKDDLPERILDKPIIMCFQFR